MRTTLFTRQSGRSASAMTGFMLAALMSPPGSATDYFDPAALELRGQVSAIDLSALEQPGGQIPGRYRTEIYLNSRYMAERILNFTLGERGLIPEITKEDLLSWGVRSQATPAFSAMSKGSLRQPIDRVLPDGQLSYDFAQRRLDISIPQAFMQQSVQGAVSPEEWDDGLPAAFVNYAYSGASSRSDARQGTVQNNYLNLRSGVNLGAWRLRNYSSWSDNGRSRQWNSINTYLQHDVKSLNAQFVAGDSYSPAGVFDSVAFRGVQLYSDDNMLPESRRGFAPVIRGIAQSNARVTIRQDGNIIYQAYVPPGPFAITDLYPVSSGGDLSVSIREADGTVRQFVQAFSAVPLMLREGQAKYALTAGKYRVVAADNAARYEPLFLQTTGSYGLTNASTFYGGIILSGDYMSSSLGSAKGLGYLGSVSIDGTWAHAQSGEIEKQGASFRFQYAKDFTASGTTFNLAGYRYSTSGYMDFNEANGYYNTPPLNASNDELIGSKQAQRVWTEWRNRHNKRSRAELNINQRLGDFGSLYLSAYQQQYWGISGRENTFNLGYSISHNAVSYTLNYMRSSSPWLSQQNNVFSLAVQIPFERFMPKSWLNVSASQTNSSGLMASAGIAGVALADNTLSYNIQQGYASRGTGGSGSATLDYKGSSGEYLAGYNVTRQTRQLNYGVMGGILVHPWGLTLSQPLGDTMALVRADKAANVKVENSTGVYTDSRGYAVVPYLSPYQRNIIKLDSGTLADDIDLTADTRRVVPGQGALVLADFPTAAGQKIMLTLNSEKTIPYGASATVTSGSQTSSGIVDDRHQVYLSGVPSRGTVKVVWQHDGCQADYVLPGDKPVIQLISLQCR